MESLIKLNGEEEGKKKKDKKKDSSTTNMNNLVTGTESYWIRKETEIPPNLSYIPLRLAVSSG